MNKAQERTRANSYVGSNTPEGKRQTARITKCNDNSETHFDLTVISHCKTEVRKVFKVLT